jgi:hypothetical protein
VYLALPSGTHTWIRQADQRTSIEGWTAKIGRDRYGRRDEIFIGLLYFTDTGWILRTSGKVFYIRTNTASFHTFVFGFCLRSCYRPTTLWACTLGYPTVLTVVHCDGTSILSLHNIQRIVECEGGNEYREGTGRSGRNRNPNRVH